MPSWRFPKSCRLRKPREFQEVYRRGRTWRGRRIRIFLLESRAAGETRAGFSTTRRMRKAVSRNRARRLMREVFRLNRSGLPLGLDLVMLWVGDVEGWGYRETEEEILDLWRQAGILK